MKAVWSFSVFIPTHPALPRVARSLRIFRILYFLPFRHPSDCHPVIYLFLLCTNISEPQFLTFVIQLYRLYLPKFQTWFSCQNLNFQGIYLTLREPNLFSIVVLFWTENIDQNRWSALMIQINSNNQPQRSVWLVNSEYWTLKYLKYSGEFGSKSFHWIRFCTCHRFVIQ